MSQRDEIAAIILEVYLNGRAPWHETAADEILAAGLLVAIEHVDDEWGMTARNMRKIVNGIENPKPPLTGDWCAMSHAVELLNLWADVLDARGTAQ